MKVYTVTWADDAQDALARLWNENPAIRRQVTRAADHIDQILRAQPHSLGELTSALHRQAVVYPLKVLFTISEDDCQVRVIYVKYWYD
jgi:hypothetical protein